ncbi:hypothetical protein CYLTODRAFT_339928, partial [Cylindrobasidium torrendii FP15055 ss-10]
ELLITVHGYADLLVATILTFKPTILYQSPMISAVNKLSGLPLSDPTPPAARGFNQAIASMVAAIGIGQIVGAKAGPVMRTTFVSMYAVWGILSLATCLTDMGSATVLFSGINHSVFAGVVY